jgi:predicted RNA-binding protein with PUA-like domain
MAHWLVKSEADAYGWDRFVADAGTEWDGVRNAAAAGHLRAMRKGDEVFYYHSGAEKRIVGVGVVAREARPDGEDGNWVSVRLEPVRPLARPVALAELKAEPALAGMAMLRQSRLSVAPVTPDEWAVILRLAA